MRWLLLLLSALVLAAPAQALTPAQALALAQGDTESRIAALNALVTVIHNAKSPAVVLLTCLERSRLDKRADHMGFRTRAANSSGSCVCKGAVASHPIQPGAVDKD